VVKKLSSQRESNRCCESYGAPLLRGVPSWRIFRHIESETWICRLVGSRLSELPCPLSIQQPPVDKDGDEDDSHESY
jgi:hypothetical protein